MERDSEKLEQKQSEAILSFLGDCILETTTTVSEDGGAVCFEALSEIAPGFFAGLASSRHLGDNWALRQGDIKKLLRFLDMFFQRELKKTTDAIAKIDVAAIAKRQDAHQTFTLLKLVAVAAVLCRRKNAYIERMMDRLSPEVQSTLKFVLEETMASLVDLEESTTQTDITETSDESPTTAAEVSETASLITSPDVQPAIAFSDITSPYKKYLQDSQERDQRIRRLEATLLEKERLLIAIQAENDSLQDTLQEYSTKLDQLTTENSKLADELDILQPKVQQLYQAQAEISAYKKHLEALSNQKALPLPDMSTSLVVSDDDRDIFPFFEDSDGESTNPIFAVENEVTVIPDDVDELATLDQLKCQMELLLESHQLKESENESLLREKEKLAAYTKRAVARYQDQYLVAKHDLAKSRQQIKEQQQLINMLQRRVEQQQSTSVRRNKKNKVYSATMKAKLQEYGLGAY